MSFLPFQPFRGFNGGAAPYSPLSLSPALWLSDTGSSDATWPDLSGNGRDATQATGAKQPAIVPGVRNGRQVRRFNGTSSCMVVSNMTLPTYITVFIVQSCSGGYKAFLEHSANTTATSGFYVAGVDSYYAAWAFNRNAAVHYGPYVPLGDWVGSGWALAGWSYDGVGRIYKNGSLVSDATKAGTARSNSNVTETLNIGSRHQVQFFISGDIAEILVLPYAATTGQRQIAERYLGAKYGISVA